MTSPVRIVRITDAHDSRLGDYRFLRDLDLRRSVEAEHGILIAEGAVTVRQLLDSGLAVRSVLLASHREPLAAEFGRGEWPVFIAPRAVLEGVTGFNIHRGVLAAANRPAPASAADLTAAASRLLVLEGVTDSENLGALIRNTAAFGIDALLLDPACGDPLARRPIRVSVGHALRLPFARLDAWPAALAELQAAGFEVLALTPHPDAEPLHDVVAGARTAVLVGAEGAGLSDTAQGIADRRVRIPMAAGVDSLNVATAAAVAFWHLYALPQARK